MVKYDNLLDKIRSFSYDISNISYFKPDAQTQQECNHCHFTDRTNRPNQQTFCCQVCGYRANADEVAANNLVNRLHDKELEACYNLDSVKQTGIRSLPARLVAQTSSVSTGVG